MIINKEILKKIRRIAHQMETLGLGDEKTLFEEVLDRFLENEKAKLSY